MPYCNLKCTWCDTEFNRYQSWTEQAFEEFATSERNRFAVITGGEPMMHKHTHKVISILKKHKFEIACETNGTYPILEGINFVTVSPKRFQETPYFIHPHAFYRANEFKYVVDDKFDFSILAQHGVFDGKIYSLSPEFNDFDNNLKRIFEYIKENPQWKISLQTHKWMKVP